MTRVRRKLRWFNAGAPCWTLRVRGRTYGIRLWNLFNRHTNDGEHWWGVGVLQVNRRHLLCIAFSGKSVLFIGQTQ